MKQLMELSKKPSTEPLGMFDYHHITRVRYPCKELLDHGNIVRFLPPLHRKDRFEPLPLIPDAAVEAHAYRHSAEETAFFSLTAAKEAEWGEIVLLPETSDSAVALCEDMAAITKLRGETELKICTFRRTEDRVYIKVDRYTAFLRVPWIPPQNQQAVPLQ